MSKPLVSIIVPFYNPGYGFNEFLTSIENQSYKNIEVILVNDGSRKEYSDIARNFTLSKGNCKLIEQKNRGVAFARQIGLEQATGDFIIHADADDLLLHNSIEVLINQQIITSSDIVVGSYIIEQHEHDRDKIVSIKSNETYEGFLEGILLDKYHASLCNKLIRSSLSKPVKFKENINYMEDKLFLATILSLGELKISFIKDPVYIYKHNNLSLTNTMSEDSIKSSTFVTMEIIKMFRNRLSSQQINTIKRNNRVFQITQYAKKGINIVEKKDIKLIINKNVSVKSKLVIILSHHNMFKTLKILLNLKSYYLRLIN